MKERYETFKQFEKETWGYRFVWRGIYGDKAYHAINLFKFFRETNEQEKLRNVKNIKSFYNKVDAMANVYVQWCRANEMHTEEEYADLRNFFIGAMGEFFFTNLLNCVKSVNCVKENAITRHDFNYVAPILKGEKDWGVDMTGVISDYDGDRNCVIQVKFWNPFSVKSIQMDVMQKAFAEGVLNGYISPSENKNVVICWLGDEEESVSHFLKENKPLNNHVVLIGKKALNETINERNGIFWNGIIDNLTNLSTL